MSLSLQNTSKGKRWLSLLFWRKIFYFFILIIIKPPEFGPFFTKKYQLFGQKKGGNISKKVTFIPGYKSL